MCIYTDPIPKLQSLSTVHLNEKYRKLPNTFCLYVNVLFVSINKMDNTLLATDSDWDNLWKVAEYQQQDYYELLAEWTKYHKDEYKFLKQNIGFSIFGPPKQSTASGNSERQMVQYKTNVESNICNVTDVICYEPKAQEVIDRVYEKICEFGDGCIDAEYIYYGIIFNVLLPIKSKSLTRDEICAETTAVFKIRRLESEASQTSADTSKAKSISYVTWYIDLHGRVYKSWSDYKTSNTLRKCTMVLPKDGFYQPNRSYEITESSSKVWLEVAESPACTTTQTILHAMDIASTITGVAGLGLGFASLFTPLAPVALGAAAVATGGTSVWGIGRSTHNLIDRSLHEETINPLEDRTAFCSWLSITGSAIGLAASGGTTLLTEAVRDGNTVSMATRMAYNSLVIGNLSINGIGIAYQAYCLYEEYQNSGQISTVSVLNLSAHILFFGNSVINLQLAGNLIELTQGHILDEYRNTIRSKRLRKQFNRVKRTAAENNTNQVHERAEVIKYINRKYELRLQNNVSVPNHNTVTFKNGVITINNITLIDPMRFVSILLKEDRYNRQNRFSEDNNSFMVCALRSLLLNLLESFNSSHSGTDAPVFDIDDYEDIFADLKDMQNALDIFRVLFKLAMVLIRDCRSPSDCLAKAVHFIWYYVKENLWRQCFDLTTLINDPNARDVLQKFINCMFEHVDSIVQQLIPAFVRYLSGSV